MNGFLFPVLFSFTMSLVRFRSHRKALVTSVDKKIPNGFLEEQGMFEGNP